MHTLYELKDMLCEELEEYGKKGELTAGTLDVVDKLTHTIKNLDKIIEKYEEEDYSQEGGSYEGSYEGGSMARRGRSNARGGRSNERGRSNRSYARGRGRSSRRDSMGRYASEGYSGNEDMIMELRELMEDAPDDRTRQEFQRFIQKMEMM